MKIFFRNAFAIGALLLASGVFTSTTAQCPARTQISDTLLNADGTPASGRVVISWPTFKIGDCQVIAGQTTVAVTGGSFNAELFPNDQAVPEGTSYRVTYYLRSGRISTEYWVVPASANPVGLAAVRSSSVPFPAVMLSMAQVTDLVPTLNRKIELPDPCPAGKFLQAGGSSESPQVNCVDGTGAPLASSTISGTVKTDANETDPLVYTKASADALLAAKADAAHGHAAADITSGTLDPARLPAPTATSLGGVLSAACAGTDKVTGISTTGTVQCSSDQGGSTGSQHQVDGLNLLVNDPVNFQDSTTIAFSNPTNGDIQAEVKDNAISSPKIADNAVTDAKLRNSAATSVIGRSAGTSGAPADIAATADDQVLRRSGGALGFGTISGGAFGSQTANTVLAAPNGAAGNPSFRALVDGDIPAAISRDTESPAAGDITGSLSAGYQIVAGAVGTAEVAAVLKTRQIIFVLGADNGAALADTDDQATIYVNRLGQGITITEVWCESDAGTPSINLQRDDGTPANILSANLSCSSSGATGTIDAAEANVANTERIDFVMVTAGGTAKRITVAIKFTLD